MIKVARIRRIGLAWSVERFCPLIQDSLLSSVFVTSDSIDNDFPMPMSSARIPPPLSSCSTLDIAPVTACRNLQRCKQACLVFSRSRTFDRLTRPVSKV